jgi:hypothetical protein
MWPANIVRLTMISKVDHMAVSNGRGIPSPTNVPWAISLPDRRADSRSRIAALVGAHFAALVLMTAARFGA